MKSKFYCSNRAQWASFLGQTKQSPKIRRAKQIILSKDLVVNSVRSNSHPYRYHYFHHTIAWNYYCFLRYSEFIQNTSVSIEQQRLTREFNFTRLERLNCDAYHIRLYTSARMANTSVHSQKAFHFRSLGHVRQSTPTANHNFSTTESTSPSSLPRCSHIAAFSQYTIHTS